jgi:hypothetical protein
MAEYSTDYISGVMAQSYDRMQKQGMAQAESKGAAHAQNNKGELLTPAESSAATELTEQAATVTEAGAVIDDALATGGEYDSYAKMSAMTQKGMKDKMKALGMLDDARDDVDIQMHVAEYVDPVTGETVNANNLEYATSDAYLDAQSSLASQGSTNHEWEQAYTSYSTQEQARAGGQSTDAKLTASQDALFDEYFVDSDAMKWAAKEGTIDTARVVSDMNSMYESTKQGTSDMINSSLDAEREMRVKQANDSTDSYNAQQTASQDIANKNNADIAASQTDLKNSINQDKQNLASQSSSMGTGSSQTKIQDTVADTRPV